jgi:hypothetical protein
MSERTSHFMTDEEAGASHHKYATMPTGTGGDEHRHPQASSACYLCLCQPKNASAGLFLQLRVWDGSCNFIAVCFLAFSIVGAILLACGAGCTLGMLNICTAGATATVVMVVGGCMFFPLPLMTFVAYCVEDEY